MIPVPALTGLNIVVTRPHHQALPLAQRIEQAGGNVLLFPLLEISRVANPQPLGELVAQLHRFDLAIFISPNAVRYGMEAICAAGTLPIRLKIATVGQGSARELSALGVQEIIAPPDQADSEALLALPALQNVSGWNIVIFRGTGGRELLADALKARGARVEYAECYQRTKPQQKAGALFSSTPHAMTITSSEALNYLWEMLDDGEKVRICALPLFVPHQRIADAAQRLGWHNVITTRSGDDGLLLSLVAWATGHQC
jgi:uroporphyrinogen-III synthase